MHTRSTLSLLLAAIVFIGAGCITIETGEGGAGNGGIFKTVDKGDAWAQRVAIPTTDGSTRGIGAYSVVTITQDLQDPNAIYIGTTENGMWFSYDGGAAWYQPAQLRRGRINAIAVDPKNKCVVYATSENRILKSTDCSRTYEATYLDTRTARIMTAIVVDAFNPNIIWIANDGGDVLKSEDAGVSWRPVTSFRSGVLRMMASADDSRRVYAGTEKHGIWRTDDAGANWLDLREQYKDIRDTVDLYDMALGVSDPQVVVAAVKQGLIMSKDRGTTWAAMELLTPASSAVIRAVAVDPKDANTIYYGTSTTFYRSPNGGVNWVPKKLPTTRAATSLLVDRSNPSVLYMGVTLFK